MEIQYTFRNEIGNHRPENLDAVLIDSERNLFLLADGISGDEKQPPISSMALEWLQQYIEHNDGQTQPAEILRRGFYHVNQQLLPFCATGKEKNNMGTTLTALWLKDESYFVGHVGDSRCYLYRKDKLHRITEDQTLVNQMVKAGQLEKEKMDDHPDKHVLIEALGAHENPDVLMYKGIIQNNDLFLLCSDGLYDMIYESDLIENLSKRHVLLESIADELVKLACLRGGYDNISLILVKIWKL